MHLAIDDNTPRRRIMFGTQQAAEAFVNKLPGWSVADSTDPDQQPVTGAWDPKPSPGQQLDSVPGL